MLRKVPQGFVPDTALKAAVAKIQKVQGTLAGDAKFGPAKVLDTDGTTEYPATTKAVIENIAAVVIAEFRRAREIPRTAPLEVLMLYYIDRIETAAFEEFGDLPFVTIREAFQLIVEMKYREAAVAHGADVRYAFQFGRNETPLLEAVDQSEHRHKRFPLQAGNNGAALIRRSLRI